MSVSSTQCQLLAYTSRKSDLEYRLLCISATRSRMAAQTAALQEELMTEVKNTFGTKQAILTDENTKDIAERIEIFNSSEFYRAYQLQTALINEKEKTLDTEKTQIETELTAINTMMEGLEKQLDSDLKKSVLNPS